MEIIDIERKGNVVRFYLGEKTAKWGWTNPDYKDYRGITPEWLKPEFHYYGDDWNDAPYEENAGPVYSEFVKDIIDVAFDFDDVLVEPCDGNESVCKNDMVARRIPCLIVISKEVLNKEHLEAWQVDDFDSARRIGAAKKIYFGDHIAKVLEERPELGSLEYEENGIFQGE